MKVQFTVAAGSTSLATAGMSDRGVAEDKWYRKADLNLKQ